MHRPDIGPPGLRLARNFYSSRSDKALGLRGNLNVLRADVPSLVDLWTATAAETDKQDFVNTIIGTGSWTTDIYLNRLFPHRVGATQPICGTYSTGTASTDGQSGIVRFTGAALIANTWAGGFIQFAASPTSLPLSVA